MSRFQSKLLGVTAAAVLACASPAPAQTMDNAVPEWLPKPAINPLPNWYEVRGGTWSVPRAVVEEMAARIGNELAASARRSLDTTTIQYQGVTANGVQAVRLMGACRKPAAHDWQLSKQFYRVFDGGECYFDGSYDPREQRFIAVTHHPLR